MQVAAGRFDASVDVSTISGKDCDFSSGRVGHVINGVYHADRGGDEEDLGGNDGWLDLRSEDPKEKERILQVKLHDSRDRGLSKQGCEELEKILREIDDTTKLKVRAGKPADIEPLMIALTHDAVPIRDKQHRYPQPKREFIIRNFRPLFKLGFVKTFRRRNGFPHNCLSRNGSPVIYGLTVDYRPINAATRPTFSPMSDIEAKLANTQDSKALASLDFCSRYWKALVHSESQPLYAFSTPEGVVMPARTTKETGTRHQTSRRK